MKKKPQHTMASGTAAAEAAKRGIKTLMTSELGYMEAMDVYSSSGKCRCGYCNQPPLDGLWTRTSFCTPGFAIDSAPKCVPCACAAFDRMEVKP